MLFFARKPKQRLWGAEKEKVMKKNTFGEKVIVVIMWAVIISGAACAAYSLVAMTGLIKSSDPMLFVVGISMMSIGILYWLQHFCPKWVDAQIKAMADQDALDRAKEEAKKESFLHPDHLPHNRVKPGRYE